MIGKKGMKQKDRMVMALAATLCIVGLAAIFVPMRMQDLEMNQDAEEYATLRKQANAVLKEATPVSESTEPVVCEAEDIGEEDAFSGSVGRIQSETVLLEPTELPLPALLAPSRTTDINMEACREQNADFIAWIQIPGTTIDYPVVLTDDVEYYLHHTFTGKESAIGTLFSLSRTDYSMPSQNIAIYGHHLRSGKNMFSPLILYKKEGFYDAHDTIHLDTLYRTGTYRIFAVVNMKVNDWDASTAEFDTGDAFLSFVNRAKSQALYDTGVEVVETDHILTLITCDRSYAGKDGRLLVMAVQQ